MFVLDINDIVLVSDGLGYSSVVAISLVGSDRAGHFLDISAS